MNRKLIRPNLMDVKTKEREPSIGKDGSSRSFEKDRDNIGGPSQSSVRRNPSTQNVISSPRPAAASTPSSDGASAPGKAKKMPPSTETHAEVFYYKKQIDSHTLMVIVLQDGEEIEGTIEWYDRNALKINRTNAPNIMLLKHNIKYMFKAEDRNESNSGGTENS